MYEEKYEEAVRRIREIEGMNLELSTVIRLAGAVIKGISATDLRNDDKEYLEKICKKLKAALREYVCEAF